MLTAGFVFRLLLRSRKIAGELNHLNAANNGAIIHRRTAVGYVVLQQAM
jgi:hypothetical protein